MEILANSRILGDSGVNMADFLENRKNWIKVFEDCGQPVGHHD